MDPEPKRDTPQSHKPTLMERIAAFLSHEPENREELQEDLQELLRGAFERKLLDADALSMIEGVLDVSQRTVHDIMIPRAQMDCLNIEDDPQTFIPFVIETRHSRFPVIGESKDDVIGILLAKDLLNYYASPADFDVRDSLRPVVFIPESKPLNVLLREFRANRNHIAIVVDEYGGVSGLVTIEDVLEQIVGDIEDEYDYDEAETNIIAQEDGDFRIKAHTELSDFNAYFETQLSGEGCETVGDLVLQAMGHLPKRDESVQIGNFLFRASRVDSRRLHTLEVSRISVDAYALREDAGF